MGRLTNSGGFSASYSLGKRRSRRNHSTRPEARRLRLEQLEQRTLLAAFSVTNANSDGAGSLRQAVLDANAAPGADSIIFADTLARVTINTVNLLITDDVDIQGPVNGPVILSGPTTLFHVFTGEGRILDIAAGANVSISRLSLMNGDATNPDLFNPPGEAVGGAIRNAGTLTVRECLFYHNGAGEPLDGLGGGGGGAIYNSGSLTVIASSFAANFADWGSGGAIYNAGTATVTNSTFINNEIGLFGGAIYNAVGRWMSVTNCTILKSGGYPNAHVLGYPVGSHGIANLGTMALNNTIVADTPVGSDVVNTFIITGSHNLIKDGSGGVPGTITGDPMLTPPNYISALPISQPLPALLPRPGLAGPPFTVPPLPGSPAIDAGNNSAISSFGDQRGAPRILNGVVDIGAVEVGIGPLSIVVTTLTDENNDSIDPTLGAGTSLREALSLKLPEDVTITFAPGLAGTIALDASLSSLDIADFGGSPNGFPNPRGPVTIVGPGAGVITLDGLGQTRILAIDNVDVSISGLTFARGAANESAAGGGAIYSSGSSSLTVSDCAFLDNTATIAGGAIHSAFGNFKQFTVNNCTFAGNFADEGGAIANESTMTVTDSTFMGNSARHGGAIWAKYYEDRFPDTPFIRPTVTSSTFSENSATEFGGAIFIASYLDPGRPAQLSVINSTISNNSAFNGGGIYVGGSLTLYGSTVYGNSSTANAGEVVAGGIAISDSWELFSLVESVTLVNNIVAGSTSGADLTILFVDRPIHFGIPTVTGSHNLIGDGSGGLPNTITGDPLLGPLADNGGPTKTHALLPGSPAINAGQVDFVVQVPGDPVAAFSDPGFETPSLAAGSFEYAPAGSAWTFSGNAGLTSNDSALGHFPVPEGSQAAFFLQENDSSISQVVNLDAGTYFLRWSAAAQSADEGYPQYIEPVVDGEPVAFIRPTRVWSSYTSNSFTVAAGPHTIQFVYLNPLSLNIALFLDQIELIPMVPQIYTIDLPTTDQRGSGFARVVGGRIDLGAVEAPTMSADFDADGDVDGADFLAWQRGLGSTGASATQGNGNADQDNDVDADDLAVWKAQFGNPAALAAAEPLAAAAVVASPVALLAAGPGPEPLATAAVAFGVIPATAWVDSRDLSDDAMVRAPFRPALRQPGVMSNPASRRAAFAELAAIPSFGRWRTGDALPGDVADWPEGIADAVDELLLVRADPSPATPNWADWSARALNSAADFFQWRRHERDG